MICRNIVTMAFILFFADILYSHDDNIKISSFSIQDKFISESTSWSQKLKILNLVNKNVGYIDIKFRKLITPFEGSFYEVNIKTESDPFWIFSSKYYTEEVEYYDENYIPILFNLKSVSGNRNISIHGKIVEENNDQKVSTGTINKKIGIKWKSNKINKNISLPLKSNICTIGSIRSIVLRNGINNKKEYNLSLLKNSWNI